MRRDPEERPDLSPGRSVWASQGVKATNLRVMPESSYGPPAGVDCG